MNQFQAIAFDPGGSTGWAYAHWDNSNFKWDGGTLTEENHHQLLRALIEQFESLKNFRGPLHVITESFDFRQRSGEEKDRRKGLDLISRNYIGVIELVCMDLHIDLVSQTPPTRDWITDKKLQQLGLFVEPSNPNRHMHDAYRHLVHYITRNLKLTAPITKYWKVGPLHE